MGLQSDKIGLAILPDGIVFVQIVNIISQLKSAFNRLQLQQVVRKGVSCTQLPVNFKNFMLKLQLSPEIEEKDREAAHYNQQRDIKKQVYLFFIHFHRT